MTKDIKKIALLTGGGDCPGLNAVIRAVTKTAILNYGYEVIGYKFGYRGLYNNDFIPLDFINCIRYFIIEVEQYFIVQIKIIYLIIQ